MKGLHERIKFLRKSLSMNQIAFAEEIGISQAALSDIEKGKSKPSINTLISISEKCGVSIDWILKGDELEDRLQKQLPLPIKDIYKRLMTTLMNEKQSIASEFNIPIEDVNHAFNLFSYSLFNSQKTKEEKKILAILSKLPSDEREEILNILELIIMFNKKDENKTNIL